MRISLAPRSLSKVPAFFAMAWNLKIATSTTQNQVMPNGTQTFFRINKPQGFQGSLNGRYYSTFAKIED